MNSLNTNSYIKCQFSTINSRIINRQIVKAQSLGLPNDIYDYEPPWYRLLSEQPEIPIANCDVTRRPQAFGRLALPKLRRELHDRSEEVVLAAITSIWDLVHDPERAYEALQLRITDRVADLLLKPCPALRERVILVLTVMAGLQEGRMAILKNAILVENLSFQINDADASIRLKTAMCLEMLARVWMAADYLVSFDLIPALLDAIREEFSDIICWHLTTFRHLLYSTRAQYLAIDEDAFEKMISYFTHYDAEVVSKALDCLMLIVSSKRGKKLAMDRNLLKDLNLLIHYGKPAIFSSAVSCIMFCTVKTRAKHQAAAIKSLPKRLVDLATNPINESLQMYALKALTNISEHPNVRELVKERYLERIKKFQVGPNEIYRQTLLEVVNWLPEVLPVLF